MENYGDFNKEVEALEEYWEVETDEGVKTFSGGILTLVCC